MAGTTEMRETYDGTVSEDGTEIVGTAKDQYVATGKTVQADFRLVRR